MNLTLNPPPLSLRLSANPPYRITTGADAVKGTYSQFADEVVYMHHYGAALLRRGCSTIVDGSGSHCHPCYCTAPRRAGKLDGCCGRDSDSFKPSKRPTCDEGCSTQGPEGWKEGANSSNREQLPTWGLIPSSGRPNSRGAWLRRLGCVHDKPASREGAGPRDVSNSCQRYESGIHCVLRCLEGLICSQKAIGGESW